MNEGAVGMDEATAEIDDARGCDGRTAARRIETRTKRPLPMVVGVRDERSDALRNRQKVLDAARRLFAEQGVEAVTMTEIAQAAGVGQGTLYRRFAHKGLLALALLDDNTRAFQNEVAAGFGDTGRGLRAFGLLRLFLQRTVAFTEVNAVLLKESATNRPGDATFYRESAYIWMRTTVLVLLREAIEAGDCDPALDPAYLADALLAPLQADLYLYQRHALGLSQDRIAAGLDRLLMGCARLPG